MAVNLEPTQSGRSGGNSASTDRSAQAWQFARSGATDVGARGSAPSGDAQAKSNGEAKNSRRAASGNPANSSSSAANSASANGSGALTVSGGFWGDTPVVVNGNGSEFSAAGAALAPRVPASVLPQSQEVATRLAGGETLEDISADSPNISDKAISGALELLGVSDRQIRILAKAADIGSYETNDATTGTGDFVEEGTQPSQAVTDARETLRGMMRTRYALDGYNAGSVSRTGGWFRATDAATGGNRSNPPSRPGVTTTDNFSNTQFEKDIFHTNGGQEGEIEYSADNTSRVEAEGREYISDAQITRATGTGTAQASGARSDVTPRSVQAGRRQQEADAALGLAENWDVVSGGGDTVSVADLRTAASENSSPASAAARDAARFLDTGGPRFRDVANADGTSGSISRADVVEVLTAEAKRTGNNRYLAAAIVLQGSSSDGFATAKELIAGLKAQGYDVNTDAKQIKFLFNHVYGGAGNGQANTATITQMLNDGALKIEDGAVRVGLETPTVSRALAQFTAENAEVQGETPGEPLSAREIRYGLLLAGFSGNDSVKSVEKVMGKFVDDPSKGMSTSQYATLLQRGGFVAGKEDNRVAVSDRFPFHPDAQVEPGPGAQVSQPPVLSPVQRHAINSAQIDKFLAKASKAPEGSDLKTTANLLKALGYQGASPDIAKHVNVSKLEGQLQTYMSKPGVQKALASAKADAFSEVTGMTKDEYVTELKDYVSTLPNQDGFVKMVTSNPEQAQQLTEAPLTQLMSLDPTAAAQAQQQYQQALFGGENRGRMLQQTSPETKEAAVTAATLSFGLGDGTQALQKSRFATSGIGQILKSGQNAPQGQAFKDAKAMMGAVYDFAKNNPQEDNAAFMAFAKEEFNASTTRGARILDKFKAISDSGAPIVGSIAFVLSVAAFGTEVSSAKTPAAQSAAAGDALLAVGNFPAFATATKASALLGRAAPYLKYMGLATVPALAAFTVSLGLAAKGFADSGDRVGAGVEAGASADVGIATIINLPQFEALLANGKPVPGPVWSFVRDTIRGFAERRPAPGPVGEAAGEGASTSAAEVEGSIELTETGAAASTSAAAAEGTAAAEAAAAEAGGEGGAAAAAAAGGAEAAADASTVDWVAGPAAPFITGGLLIAGSVLAYSGYYLHKRFEHEKSVEESKDFLQSGVGDGEDYYV